MLIISDWQIEHIINLLTLYTCTCNTSAYCLGLCMIDYNVRSEVSGDEISYYTTTCICEMSVALMIQVLYT